MNRKKLGRVLLAFTFLTIAGSVFAEPGFVQEPGNAPSSSEPASGYVHCDTKTGMCRFKARAALLKQPVTFSDFALWRYDPAGKKWLPMLFNAAVTKTITPEQKTIYSPETDPVVRNLTGVTGLLWLRWHENERPYSSLVFSGTPCNDVMIGPERKDDMIATCIPGKDRATAAYVPDPELYCKEEPAPDRRGKDDGR